MRKSGAHRRRTGRSAELQPSRSSVRGPSQVNLVVVAISAGSNVDLDTTQNLSSDTGTFCGWQISPFAAQQVLRVDQVNGCVYVAYEVMAPSPNCGDRSGTQMHSIRSDGYADAANRGR